MESQNQEANSTVWHEYFARIKTYCPWSWASWNRHCIDIQTWQGTATPLQSWDARIYLFNRKPRLLKKIAEQQMELYPAEEWLYSHPQYQRAGTPYPCMIQQDQNKLDQIRAQYNKKDQENLKNTDSQ